MNIKNKTIDRILSEVLDGTNLTYFLNDRQVMIIRKEEKTQQEKKISINGTVRDAQQEPLPGVNVLVKGTTIGTTTDIDGNYFISVPDKNAVLVFSYIGFVNPAKRNVMVVKNEMRLLKQKRNVLQI